MKRIDKGEEKYLDDQKFRNGIPPKERKKQIQRDKYQVNELSKINRIKRGKLKKDPKEINKRFKEGIGNLK